MRPKPVTKLPDLKYVDDMVMLEILEFLTVEIARPDSPLGVSIKKLFKEADNAPASTR